MFYSQFILAKKGPLGTIWIAAHLERKLRKNQVADTDIGVSVDSILFPDVPIALRLSSHLLLGVVRIYSRKVNYLFDDCSEALLKIKQAFRSTAVDLPPEESTAPYHSITLPETFDLDDFELPDNDVFQGNYDHHISTKEQITLQDTMEGVVFSTSQFGLDERFGDGDTSQIGLDLTEDLFLDKFAAPGHAGVMLNSGADPQTSFQPITPFEEDENNEEMNETSQAMAAGVSGNQDYAEAPSTPGLVEEPNLSNVQKALASDDHLEPEDHNSTDLEAIENVGTASSKSDHHGDKHDLQMMTPDGMPVEENEYNIGGNEIQHLKPQGDLLTTENVEHLQNGILSNNEASVDLREVGRDGIVSSPSSFHGVEEDNYHKACSGVENIPEKFSSSSTQLTVAEGVPENDHALLPEISSNEEISKNLSCTYSDALAPISFYPLEPAGPEADTENQVCNEPKDCKTSEPDEEMPSTRVHVLQPCNSDLNHSKKLSHGSDSLVALPDLPNDINGPCSMERSGMEEAIIATGFSVDMQGEEFHPTAAAKPLLEATVMLETNLSEDIEADRSYLDAVSKDTLEFPDSSAVSDLPAPEKLLSMPDEPSNLLNNLLVETTPDKVVPVESEGDGTGITMISGRKRSFTESTLTLQSLNSDESFAKPQSKRTAEFIPDDDDLLSSILVGRRSSILKMKPTPTPSEVVPMKRPRTTPRISASKRKVLMDDSMVLHGDTIRQQLTSAEDIRRVRKKAPSTRHEIWIIQKQFLEDELFSEPISTGMSIELIGLHNQTYDLSSIRISLDGNIASLESAKEMEPTVWPTVIQGNETEGSTESSLLRIDGEVQPAGVLVQLENQQGEANFIGSRENDSQLPLDATSADFEVKTSNHEHGEIAEMEIGGESVEVAHAAECAVAIGAEISCPTGPVSDSSIMDLSNGKGIDAVNVGDIHNDIALEFEADTLTRGDYLHNGAGVGENFEVREDSCAGSSRPTDNADPSISTMSPETGECKDLLLASNNQFMEEIAKDEPEFVKEHEDIDTELGYDDKDPASNHMSCEEPTADSSYLVKCDVNNTSLNGGGIVSFNDVERPSCLEAEAHGIMDLENTDLDHHVVKDHGDTENIVVEHDTEFLNVDDDDVADEDDNYMPSAEETRFLENSGWSSRSRAVAKYLQTLFDKETELGKKVIPMDNLLAGKTRKEASRMFFETLVLKTRDYIHVEQQNPFNNINIKPRGKLLKSDF